MPTSNSDHYRELQSFLLQHASIWHSSILQNWPSSRSAFPEAWIDWIATLEDEDQRAFGDESLVDGMPQDLRALLERCHKLSEVETLSEEAKLDQLDVQGLNNKKQHEIERLLPLLKREGKDVQSAVDIGGGMGHLARLCVKTFGWRFRSIDRDSVLQEKGLWWLKRSRGLPREQLSFINSNVSDENQPMLDPYFAEPQSLSLGLHTCGPLALSQFRKSMGSSCIINFGCCYDKMDAENIDHLNLSREAKASNLPWSHAALFLATRSRKEMTREEFALLKRVNSYRFTLDLFFRKYFPERGFIIAGDASKALYGGRFSAYAFDRMQKLHLESPLSENELEGFFSDSPIQTEVTAIFAAHLIRNLFARPLECAILLDRALWLEEKGFAVKLRQVFDRGISPRNIAVIAHRLPYKS